MFEVLDKIYWNDNKSEARKGITNPRKRTRKGDLTNRFPRVIRQLERAYDLQDLDADQLIELLGDEFVFSTR